jgi:hypothetical protein
MVLTMPTFLVYTGLPSKEFLTILFFLPVVQQTAYFLINKRMNLPLVFLFLSLGFFMRPHYGIAYFFLVVVTLFSTKINLNNKIIVPIIIGLIGITSITILFNYFSVFDNGFWSAIQRIKMVYRNGDSFRPDVPWESTKDYFRHLWWGIPMSIIGPFPNEIIERPKLLIPFVFGLISLAMIFILGFKTYRLVKVNKTLAFVIKYGFGIGVFIILLIHFPFGIFNPGAGFRFKQNLAPFLYFYPLFVIGYYNKKKSESNSTD